MKLKNYIILLCLFMVLMCCACSVSAASVDSMNSTVSDVDEIDESISQIDDENADDLQSSEENDDTLELKPSDFKANISSDFDLADDESSMAEVYCPESAKGKVYFYLDDGKGYAESDFEYCKPNDDVSRIIPFLPGGFKNLEEGTYNARLVWNNNGNNVTLKEGKINVYMTITPQDFIVTTSSEVTQSDEIVVNVWDFPTKGELSAFVDGKKRYSKTISNKDDDVDIYLNDLKIIENGNYEILLKFKSVSNREVTLDDFAVSVELDEDDDDGISIDSYTDIKDPEDSIAHLNLLDYIDGTVTVSIDGKEVYKKIISASQEIYVLDIFVRDMNLANVNYGNHPVVVTYTRDGDRTISDNAIVKLTTIPNVYWPNYMSLGEEDALIIKGDSGVSGSVSIYNAVKNEDYDYSKGSVFATAKITNGYARIPLSKLTEGIHFFFVDYTFGNYQEIARNYMDMRSVTVFKNSNDFTSSISASTVTVGNSVSVNLNGIKTDMVYIYLDGVLYKKFEPFNGAVSENIQGLSAGTHHITVKIIDEGNDKYYSKTYQVNVKPVAPPAKTVTKLTLKKVTVKKSAKKLVLTATLKINKKAAKGKKITFKFNGKTYKAKTNKKGVAKVTIKKNVLKKLKVGKKVKIQAKFGKTTKKLTVKVKK